MQKGGGEYSYTRRGTNICSQVCGAHKIVVGDGSGDDDQDLELLGACRALKFYLSKSCPN